MKIQTPDYISIYTENDKNTFSFSNNIKKDDITVDVSLKNELLHIDLTADQTPVKYISLRWNFNEGEKRNEQVKIYGDVWERGYCDLEWHGVAPDLMMPWVCAVSKSYDII